MWHRLSVHVKNKDMGSNQMAVIKPLTKSYQGQAKSLTFSDISTKTLYNVVEEEEIIEQVRFHQPCSPSMVVHRRVTTTPPPSRASEEDPLYLSDQAAKNVPPQRSLMDQLHGVVSKFTTGIPDFNSVITTPGPGNGVRQPLYQPPMLQQQVLPLQMTTFSEELATPVEELESEKFNLIQGYMYDNCTESPDEELAQSKLALEDSPALTPPSPFRDSVASGSSVASSPASESVICTPPNTTYASVILRDYKQNASTL